MITPYELKDLYNREDIKKELIYLENLLDSHLYEYYEDGSSKIPGIELERLNSNTEKLLISLYSKNGWIVSFEAVEDKNKYLLYIKEKE